MWPLVDKRKKTRRHVEFKEKKRKEKRFINRRKELNWTELFIRYDDPDIS
ncbi:MAG: hypothetical protein PF487_14205 [Bacteroidales bacterium]|jgi:hypothetical protein|nr:hypothetical protein [Bacteroidales bacterium]